MTHGGVVVPHAKSGSRARHEGSTHPARVAVLWLFLSPARVFAQVPDVALPQHSARLSALAGAGAGLTADADGRSLNPASLASDDRLLLSAGYSRAAVSDVVGVRIGAAASLGRWGSVALDARQRRVEKLIDDPDLAAEPGFRVSDLAIRLSYARRFARGRLSVGVAGEWLSSAVFATEGEGWDLHVGTTFQFSRDMTLGVAAARLGPAYRWTASGRGQQRSPLGRAVITGLRWRPLDRAAANIALVADGEFGLEGAADDAYRAGAELSVRQVLVLRGGYEAVATGNDWRRAPSAGLGLMLHSIRIDLARDRIGSEVGERTLVEVTLSR